MMIDRCRSKCEIEWLDKRTDCMDRLMSGKYMLHITQRQTLDLTPLISETCTTHYSLDTCIIRHHMSAGVAPV